MNPSQDRRKTIMTYNKVKSGKGFLIKKIKKQMEKRRDVSLHNTKKQARDFLERGNQVEDKGINRNVKKIERTLSACFLDPPAEMKKNK